MSDRYKELIARYGRDLMSLQHVKGVGYGLKEVKGKKTDREAIIVLVDRKLPPEKIVSRELVPQEVEDYHTDVIEIGQLCLHDLRTERMRPARPGVSIGHYKVSAGTFGALVRDVETGQPFILSNNHVLANISNGWDNRARKGDDILQPGSYDSGNQQRDVIARLERFQPIYRSSGDRPGCPVARVLEEMSNHFLHLVRTDYSFRLFKKGYHNLVDCALARPLEEDEIAGDILEIGEITGTNEPKVGMAVKKSGRTSGLTRGKVNILEATVEIEVDQEETAVFENQFLTTPISRPGDSGSLVVDEDNRAIGLLFAGSNRATVCNRIDLVLRELKVEF
ncbi:MAG: hypothetical protein ACOCZ3_02720 [Bacillota bacterium]